MNRAKNTDPNAIMIAQLKEQLDAARKKEKTLTEQNELFQDRISVLAKVEKKLSAEQTLREQKENELRKFRNTETDNKKLTSEVQALQGQVAKLKGKNVSASKRLEKQEQLLKDKDAEQEKLKEKLIRRDRLLGYYEEDGKELSRYRDSEVKVKQRLAELTKELDQKEKQNQVHLGNISCLKRQIKNLERENSELQSLQRKMSCQMDQMRQNKEEQNLEIESLKAEAMKQANLVSKLRGDVFIGNKVKRKLEKNADETMQRIKDQDKKISDLRAEIQNKNNEDAQMKTQMTALKSERDLTLQNLSKAQREIGPLKTTVENQQQEIQARTLDQKKMSTQLDQVKKDYDSVSNQLTEARREIECTKVFQDRYKDNVQQDLKLEEKKYRVILTEKEELERELQLCQHQASQQQHTITVQEAAKNSLEQTVKTLKEEIKSLTLQNKEARTEHNGQILEYKRLVREVVSSKDGIKCVKQYYNSTHDLYKHRQEVLRERRVQSQAALVKEQRKEIEELKRTLALRPDGVTIKLVRCQWENRDLKKQIMALKGETFLYKRSFHGVREEKEKLEEALSQMKVEAWNKGKANKAQSANQGDPSQVPRHTRFQLSAARTPSQTEDRSSRVPVLPPITNKTQLSVGKLMPFPPPPSQHPPASRLLGRRLLPPIATPVRMTLNDGHKSL